MALGNLWPMFLPRWQTIQCPFISGNCTPSVLNRKVSPGEI